MSIYTCDNCNQLIELGEVRLTCSVCIEYDLCSDCYDVTEHKSQHEMQEFEVEELESEPETDHRPNTFIDDIASGDDDEDDYEEEDDQDETSSIDSFIADDEEVEQELMEVAVKQFEQEKKFVKRKRDEGTNVQDEAEDLRELLRRSSINTTSAIRVSRDCARCCIQTVNKRRLSKQVRLIPHYPKA